MRIIYVHYCGPQCLLTFLFVILIYPQNTELVIGYCLLEYRKRYDSLKLILCMWKLFKKNIVTQFGNINLIIIFVFM